MRYLTYFLVTYISFIAHSQASNDLLNKVDHYATKNGANLEYFRAIIQHESRLNPFALNVAGEIFEPSSKEEAIQLLKNLQYRPWMVRTGTNKKKNLERYFFSSEQAANQHAAILKQENKSRIRIKKLKLWSTDVGLGQLNWYWHGKNFKSIDEMFDIDKNLDYASKYLSKMTKQAKNNPRKGAAWYHNKASLEIQGKYLEHIDYWRHKAIKEQSLELAQQ